MNASDYITRLDALVKVISPGLFAFTVAIILLEVALLRFNKVSISHKAGVVSIISGAFGFGLEAVAEFFFYLAITYWLYEHRIFELGFKWYVWATCFILFDFIFYWSHRTAHEVRLLWCLHSVHHSSQEMRLSSAVRGPMFEFLVTPWYFVWLCFLGFHPLMFIAVRTFSRVWGVLEHVSEPFVGHHPWLNKIFITPDVHRVHHGKNVRYLDMNYSEVLSIWDRLFGTYIEYGEKPDYGLLKDIDANNFFEIQFHPWRDLYADLQQALGLKNKVKLLFMPPGWYPDGRDLTAKTLKKQEADGQISPAGYVDFSS